MRAIKFGASPERAFGCRVWLFAAEISQLRLATARTAVAGLALAIAGLLLIIAAHWGHVG